MLIPKVQAIRRFCTNLGSTYYVTTPIFYVNAAPHIGHLYSAVIADAICRYQKLLAKPESPAPLVRLCTGTDEHGTKVQQAAASHSIPVDQYCNDISARYRNVFQQAVIQNNDFIRTTEQRHKKAVAHFWQTLNSRGHIYSANYQGWYCVSDETFLTDSQLRVEESTGERFSLESGHPAEWTEEKNYMFRLGNLQDDIIYWLKQGGKVKPLKFEKILFDMLSEPLPDVSVSRPAQRVQWAIPVPEDPSQSIYVWLDALVNYLTSAGYPDPKFQSCWPPKVQVIGKDILKFHGIYWPAFLIAAGLEPPQELFVHSHWTVDGQKMSKSKNNVVDPMEAAETYTMEGLRYFLLREGVPHSDGNYSSVKAMRILNAELADTMGNLLSRVCGKSLNPWQIYPRLHTAQLRDIMTTDTAKHLLEMLEQLKGKCTQHYDERNFYLVVDAVMSTLHAANSFFETSRPWELKLKTVTEPAKPSIVHRAADENALKLETIMAMTMDTLRLCGIALQPILPAMSTRLLDKLSVPWSQRLWHNLDDHFGRIVGGQCEPPMEASLSRIDAVLFRRIYPKDDDEDQGAAALAKALKNKKGKKGPATPKQEKADKNAASGEAAAKAAAPAATATGSNKSKQVAQ
ncbi:methionine--tRNA ligase, mitochondrial [Stomoxys calcitrans]|uniref:methionine--tRNA ligase, mitochondrial n=1 Tax=Stomoxys calcitrans TaxID=35570 RepID=UPI0027E37ABA|nr:methionine--tRNA ligase, mitochondrial [Stomoxys calcitrans]